MTPDTLLTLALWILFLPLGGFLLLLAFRSKLPRQGDVIETAILGIALVLSIVVMIGVLNLHAEPIPGFNSAPIQANLTWVDFHSTVNVFGAEIPLKIELGILLDNISAIMLVVVTIVSFLVHLFSIGYMHGDAKYSRYFAYLGLFTFSMLGIVLTNNIFMMYVFWELVGVSSYLLIGFWYEKPGPAYASKKAFIVNRIGDIGMWTGIMVLFTSYGTFRFDEIFQHISLGHLPYNSSEWMTAAGVLIFLGAIGKSAQFPLQTWLPDAMEGPTPVSALIHAATMVAAGVYLVARVFPLMTGEALFVVAIIGTITAFLAATIALVQNDIKKVLAYSTVSQLGYMILALGVGAYSAAVFHLVTHAMFKACLFLGSGAVIHAMHHSLHHLHDHETDPQDLRSMGGLKAKMPVTYLTFLVATLAISGVPLFSGFLSKDEILAGAWAFGGLHGGLALAIPYIGFAVAAMTAFYMFRLVFLVFHGEPRRTDIHEHVHEVSMVMKLPLIILSTLSVWVFFSFNPFGGASGWFMQNVTIPTSVTGALWYPFAAGIDGAQKALEEAVHHAHGSAMITSMIVAALGIGLAFLFYIRRAVNVDALEMKLKPAHTFLTKKWFFDEIYEQWVVVPFVLFITRIMNWFDQTIIDGAVNGTASITKLQSKLSGLFDKWVVDGLVNLSALSVGVVGVALKKTQTGRIQSYITFAILGVLLLFYVFY